MVPGYDVNIVALRYNVRVILQPQATACFPTYKIRKLIHILSHRDALRVNENV